MYPLFGGYWGYDAAPASKVQRHALRYQARLEAEAEVREAAEREHARNS